MAHIHEKEGSHEVIAYCHLAIVFALVLSLMSFDVQELPAHFSTGLPRRGIGLFLIVSGAILALVWLVLSLVPALLRGTVPTEVSSYTTFNTAVVDIGVVAPALVVSGALLLRKAPLGYLLASIMLVFTVVLGVNLTAGGIAQVLTGVIGIGQFIVMTLPFVILTLIALWLTVILLRTCSDMPTGQSVLGRLAHA